MLIFYRLDSGVKRLYECCVLWDGVGCDGGVLNYNVYRLVCLGRVVLGGEWLMCFVNIYLICGYSGGF